MNNMNMGNVNPMAGGPVGPAMPMMNNGAPVPPGAAPRQPVQPHESSQTLLNTYIYEYFLHYRMWDCARALLNADSQVKVAADGPNGRRDENGNLINGVGDESMDVDSKDDIDSKRPDDLPASNLPDSDSCFLHEWFSLFWDMFSAQKGNKHAHPSINQYLSHTQAQNRLRHSQQQDMLRQMRPDFAQQQQQQQFQIMQRLQNGGMAMGMNMKGGNNLPRTAMANSQNNPQAMHMLQQKQGGPMNRDPSEMEASRARPGSPGSAENAPSPSKRPRIEGGPFNPSAPGGMQMPNGRPMGQGMPGQQLQNFQNQSPAIQQKTIQTYAANLQQHQSAQMAKPMPNVTGPPGQGSPMIQAPDGTQLNAYYNAEGMNPGGRMPGGPGGGQQPAGSNHALQDYQMQLMLLEQQNKKRLMMARQEQDTGNGNGISMPREGPGGPGGPGGPNGPPGQNAPFQGTSPQGGRPGASPNPAEQMKRGPQQMSQPGMGSPLPEGAQSRGSPNTINFMGGNQADPNMAPHFFKDMSGMNAGGNMMVNAQMNGGMRPPSSHPGQQQFNGPISQQQQQIMAARQAQQQQQQANQAGQQMQWQPPQQGGPGGANGNQMGPHGQTPQQVQGTPQTRNAMPPPAQPAAAAAAANARNTQSPQVSNAAPPTPSQSTKAAPKKKEKAAKDKRTAAQKKSNSNLNASATPAAEPAPEPEAPAPATPMTPVNPQGFAKAGQNPGPPQVVPNGQPPAPPVPQQQPGAPAPMPPTDPNQNQPFGVDNMDFSNMDFANPLTSGDVLNDFDFDSFLHDGDGDNGTFDFTAAGAFSMDPTEIES